MATPQSKVLATATAEIGYSRWSDPKQGTKYARETQPVFWPRDFWLLANGISYCDIFVTWVFWKALGKDFVTSGALPAGASYNTDYRASKGGRVSKPPRPGDVLVFDWNWATAATNHVGILEKVLPSGNYQTIEGNTSVGSSGSQSNGGRVARRTRRPSQVRYVIRPNWSKASSSGGSSSGAAPDTARPWRTSPRVAAFTRAEVRTIQEALADLDYELGSWGADGSYGDATGRAVKALQQDLDITADGVYGPGTEKALMSQLDYIKRVVVQNQKEIRETREHAKRAADIAAVNQRSVRLAAAQTGPIKRDGKDISLRQEIADVKTILLGQDLPAIIAAAVSEAGTQDPDALAARISERLADGLTLTVSATANDEG